MHYGEPGCPLLQDIYLQVYQKEALALRVQIGMILGLAGSIGAIAAPFIAGQIADRYFSTEKILAFLVTIGVW